MISMEVLGTYPADILPRQALVASNSQAYRTVEKHHPKMGQSARSHSAGVPALRNLQQTQPIPRDAGAGAEGQYRTEVAPIGRDRAQFCIYVA